MKRHRSKRGSRSRGNATTCRTAIGDYLIWGDAAYTFLEWAARKCIHFVIKDHHDLIFLLISAGHLFYIAYAMRVVYGYMYHSTQPRLSRLIPAFLLVYAVLCVLTYLSTSVFSPVSYITLSAIEWVVALIPR